MSDVILITGSRYWTDRTVIAERLRQEPEGTTLIEGGAAGADHIAAEIGRELGFKVIEVPANWARFGPAAGPIRNRTMLDMLPHRVIAFSKNNSKGTRDCIKAARERGIPVEIIEDLRGQA